tara:strand:+ start:91903 stop:92040 length:138 start_codon:yes stop_codon:yes gene_type:complete
MKCLVGHWLPGQSMTENSMAEALYLEQRYWENMSNAIANGINKVL